MLAAEHGRASPRSARGAVSALPAALAARAYGPAWVIAITAHLMLVGVALLPSSPPPEEPPLRLVFVEPPPPPPAPIGAPGGSGTIPAMPEPVLEPKAAEQPKTATEPERKEPERLRRLDAKAKPKPQPKAKPHTRPADERLSEVPPAEIASGVATGSVGGVPGGLAGGVKGGVVGGIVGGTGSGPVPVGRVANPPTLVRRVAPVYPEEARRADVEGLVVLEAVLDHNGRIEPGIKVLRSIPMLDDAAVRAVERWRFQPARDANGRTLRVILEVPIRFVLR